MHSAADITSLFFFWNYNIHLFLAMWPVAGLWVIMSWWPLMVRWEILVKSFFLLHLDLLVWFVFFLLKPLLAICVCASGHLCVSVHRNAGEVVPDDLVHCRKKRERSFLNRHIVSMQIREVVCKLQRRNCHGVLLVYIPERLDFKPRIGRVLYNVFWI